MCPDLEEVQILCLLVGLVVELQEVRHERGIGFTELLMILHVVQDGAGLRLHFVDVHVVLAGDRVALLLSGGALLALLLLSLLRELLSQPHLRRAAVVEVTALLLPEIFQLLAFQGREIEVLGADLLALQRDESFELCLVDTVARDGHLTLVLIGAAVHDLELVELILDELLEVLPVDLVLGIGLLVLIFRQKVHN